MNSFLLAIKALLFGREPGTTINVRPVGDAPEPTVLAIDDDPSYLSMLRLLLREEGIVAITATSGDKGMELVRHAPENVQVLLLDYNMPGLSGPETLQQVRSLRPGIKIIAVTGTDVTHLLPEFRDGVDRLVLKPFRSAELITQIKDLITPSPALS